MSFLFQEVQLELSSKRYGQGGKQTRRERLKSAPYLRLKKRKTIF